MSSQPYPIVIDILSEDDGGGYVAYVVDLPGCMSDGATEAEALKNVLNAMKDWLDEAQRLGRAVPAPYSARETFRREQSELHDHMRRLMEFANKQSAALKEQSQTVNELEHELQGLRAIAAEFQSQEGCFIGMPARSRLVLFGLDEPLCIEDGGLLGGGRLDLAAH